MAQASRRTEQGILQRWNGRDSLWYILSTATPIILLSIFTILHVSNWLKTGSYTGLAFGLQEALLVALFLMRRRPVESMNTVGAWIAAVCGSWGLLLLRPDGAALLPNEIMSLVLQFTGAGLSIVATLFLGRSFGIVAANRGVKTDGAYRIVRHPIYASYLLSVAGYLLASFSIWNFVIVAVAVGFQLRRIHDEESVLMRYPEYQEYAARTRYRLIPGLY